MDEPVLKISQNYLREAGAAIPDVPVPASAVDAPGSTENNEANQHGVGACWGNLGQYGEIACNKWGEEMRRNYMI